jgi:hypothetical protein
LGVQKPLLSVDIMRRDMDCEKLYFDPSLKKEYLKQGINFKHGVAFKDNQAIYMDASEMQCGDLYLSKKEILKRKNPILKYSILHMASPNYLFVFDSSKKSPTGEIFESRKDFCMKIYKYQLWLKDLKSDWEPVTMKFLEEIPEPDHGDECYPVMLLELKTKWFQGVYELYSQ